MMNYLNSFCQASGEKINKSKSSFFFSQNVSPELRGKIKRISGMHVFVEIGRYLGFLLTNERRTSNKFQYIIEKIKSKLAGWKSSYLSTTSRVVLAKLVLTAMPLYPIQVLKIPIFVCNEIEKLQRNFIWGNLTSRGFHPLNWSHIMLPKPMGGWDLQNSPMLTKPLEPNSLGNWLGVLKDYGLICYSKNTCSDLKIIS